MARQIIVGDRVKVTNPQSVKHLGAGGLSIIGTVEDIDEDASNGWVLGILFDDDLVRRYRRNEVKRIPKRRTPARNKHG